MPRMSLSEQLDLLPEEQPARLGALSEGPINIKASIKYWLKERSICQCRCGDEPQELSPFSRDYQENPPPPDPKLSLTRGLAGV